MKMIESVTNCFVIQLILKAHAIRKNHGEKNIYTHIHMYVSMNIEKFVIMFNVLNVCHIHSIIGT